MNKLHVAISRVALDQVCTIGSGIRLEPTYAYVFAHPMLAIKPPLDTDNHHPGPWTAVEQSGYVETANVKLVLDETIGIQRDASVYRARSVIALLRLIAGSPIHAPVCSDMCFADIPIEAKKARVHQFEPPLQWPMQEFMLTKDVVVTLAFLLTRLDERREDDSFNAAFRLLGSIWWIPTLSAQMIAIWSAAETLMQPSRNNMTKKLAGLIRTALGKDRSHGDRIFNDIVRLYSARGSATHAGREPDPKDVQASYHIVQKLMIRALEGETARP